MNDARRIRVLRLTGSPRERGLAHGRAYAEAIRRYTEERVHLAADGSWAGRPVTRADVLALAEEMLPAHRAYAPDLYEEMVALVRTTESSADPLQASLDEAARPHPGTALTPAPCHQFRCQPLAEGPRRACSPACAGHRRSC